MKYVVAGALALAAIVGCGDTIHIHEAPDGGSESVETGGVYATGGMEALTGGAEETGGESLPTGGTVEPDSGGMEATGGAVAESGGSVETGGDIETGGAQMTGGEVVETGGTVVETGGMEPCPDDDSDGVCNDVDVCPVGSDADNDGNGFADACDTVLWSAETGGKSVHGSGGVTYTVSILFATGGDTNEYTHDFAPATAFEFSASLTPDEVDFDADNLATLVTLVDIETLRVSRFAATDRAIPDLSANTIARHTYRVTYDIITGHLHCTWEVRGY